MRARNSLPSPPLEGWLISSQSETVSEPIIHFLLQFQSSHTRRSYQSDLQSFFDFWLTQGIDLSTNLPNVGEKHVALWLETFKHGATRARRLASLGSFFKFCEERNWTSHNPCLLMKRPRVTNRKSAVALNEAEVEKLLHHLHERAFLAQFTGTHALRQKATALLQFTVIHTLFTVGMRVDELCELRMCDVTCDSSPAKIKFVTKGGEEHCTIVSEGCAEVLKFYINNRRRNCHPDDFLFIRVQTSEKSVKLSQTSVFNMIRSAALQAGINKMLSPHSARATVATVLHRNGVPLGFIQSLLNHKQITTTANYVKKANERNESAALKAPVTDWLNTKESQ